MAKILTFEISDNEYEELEKVLDDLHNEICKSREIMQKDQAEIDRLKAETKEIKERTQRVAIDTRKVLNELSAKWLKAA